MPFTWKKLFPDISSLRIRRSKKDHRTQSTSGDIEGDASAPPADSNTLGIQSTLRTTSDVAQTVLPGVAAVAGVIPVAGSPLQAAIGGLLFILQGIDRNRQNTQGIDDLELLLEELRSCLDSAPDTTDPRELGRRKFLTRMLEQTKFELENNMNGPVFVYTARATQVIAGCSSNINTYLNLYSASSHMQLQDGVGAILAILQSNQSLRNCMLQYVTLVDATGYEHPVPVELCHSFKQLSIFLRAMFEVESNLAQIQRRYLEAGQYDLTIDRATEVTRLTNDDWPTIVPGTKIVMSIVTQPQQIWNEAYECQGCKTWNAVPSVDSTQNSLIECGGCRRRFQVFPDSERSKEKQSIKITKKGSSYIYTSATDTHLIQNWRLEPEIPIARYFIWERRSTFIQDSIDADDAEDVEDSRNTDDGDDVEDSRDADDDDDVEDSRDADDDEDVQDSRNTDDDDDVEDSRDADNDEDVEHSRDTDDDDNAYDLTAPVTMLPATGM